MNRRAWITAVAMGMASLLWTSCVTTGSGGGSGSSWSTVASALQTGGDAKEVSVNRAISRVRFRAISGPVTINTFWVRDGAARRQYSVGRTLNAGELVVIELGARQNVSGLRIGDGGGRRGRGTYTVDVQ